MNSRGKSSYSTAGNEYTIDRWKTQYGTGLTVENGYINVIGNWQIYQTIKNPKDGVYTFAVEARINAIGDYTPNMDIGGKIETSFGTNIGEWKIHILQYDLSTITDETISLSIAARGGNSSGSISVKWAALYKGAYDADTLPPYVPKGKHVEMLNCNVPLAPHNLLDNSDFTNPVNQREIASGAVITGWDYFIDRWQARAENCSVNFSGEGITASTPIGQILPKETVKNGMIVTAAAKWSDGTICVASGAIRRTNDWGSFSSANINGHSLYVSDEGDGNHACITISEGTVIWAALYEGFYDASTLPAYQPKGYAAELAECQRYYRKMPYPVIPCANNPAGTQVYGFLPFRMRIASPTVSCDTLYFFKGDSTFCSVSSALAASYGAGTRIVFNLSQSVEGNLAGAIAGNGITLNANL